MQNPIVKLLFNRGGIGTSMSRAETVDHLNPLIEQHMRLNQAYNAVIDQLDEDDVADRLKALQKTARADVGKLSETVFSAGGTAYNGVELRDQTPNVPADSNEGLVALHDREQAFHDAVSDELDLNHQLRTQAILEVVQGNSDERLKYLKGLTKGRR